MKRKSVLYAVAAIVLTALIFSVSVLSAALPFKDVRSGDWFYDSVDRAYSLGLIKGRTETEFAPKGTMTRAELVILMSRVLEEDTKGFASYGASFGDVRAEAWYAEAVGWAYFRGLVAGYDGNVFKPDNQVSRQELAVIMDRLLHYDGIYLGDDPGVASFSDGGAIAEWSRDSIEAMRLCGLVKGDDRNNFNPKASVTRAEVATIVVRLYDKMGEDPMYGVVDHFDELCNYEKNRINITLGYAETFTLENLNKIMLRDCAGLSLEKYTLVCDLTEAAKTYGALSDGKVCSVKIPLKIKNLDTGKVTGEKTYSFAFTMDCTFRENEKDIPTFDYKIKKDGTAEIVRYIGNGNAREITVPKTLGGYKVTSVGDGAFYSNRELTKVTIPEGVTTVGQRAFALCTSLKEVRLPESVTKIKRAAFYYCTSLTSINLPKNTESLSDYLFHMCSSLRFIEIPEGVKEIGAFAFNCAGLEMLELPAGIKRIDDYSFEGCSMRRVYIPDSCEYLGGWAFYNCAKLTDFSFGNGVRSIGSAILYNTAVKEVEYRGTYAEFSQTEQVSSIESDKLLVCVGNKG